APAQPDNLYQSFQLDTRTGGLAAPGTPAQFIASKVFLVLPPAARDWALQNGIPQPPAEAGGASGPAGPEAPLHILSPDPNTVYQISPRLPLSSQQVPFQVVAAGALRSVSYSLDGQPLGTVSQAPFALWWALAPGKHTLQAQARLADGQSVSSEAV